MSVQQVRTQTDIPEQSASDEKDSALRVWREAVARRLVPYPEKGKPEECLSLSGPTLPASEGQLSFINTVERPLRQWGSQRAFVRRG